MELKLLSTTLLAWLWFVDASPFHSRTFIPDKEIKKGSYIKHYTRALYDNEILRQHRAQTRPDSLSIGNRVGAGLNLHLNALDRIFKMKLVRDTSIFHHDAHFEMSNGRAISFNPFHVYIGSLEACMKKVKDGGIKIMSLDSRMMHELSSKPLPHGISFLVARCCRLFTLAPCDLMFVHKRKCTNATVT